jgi:glutamate--cysteine ligase
LDRSQHSRDELLELPYSAELKARFAALTKSSLEEQKHIEANDSLPFEIYRQQYLSVERLDVHRARTLAHT